jgi:molecular chaperone GrpE
MADMHEDEYDKREEGNRAVSGAESWQVNPEPGADPDQGLPEVELLRDQLNDLNDRFLRLAADFDNYRKRSERDLDTHIRYAIEKFAAELIEVVDNFDRALSVENSSAKEGLEQISKLFRTILERHGISPVESVGKPFNPAEHDAIACIPSDAEEGVVIDEVCKGYRMHDKIIRCAKVTVSKGKESE